MFFEILLLSVAVVTGYIGLSVLRHVGPGQRTYRYMLLANSLLAVVAYMARRDAGAGTAADLAGAVAIGACVCLVMVPTLLRDAAARAYRNDRIGLALKLVGLRELLQPGMGAAHEAELLGSILRVRQGRLDDVVAELEQARAAARDGAGRRRVDERILMLYLYGRRWRAAADLYEARFAAGAPPSPQSLAEMVRAYCEIGELELAGQLLQQLEGSPLAREPLFALLVHRARLVFLATVGRTAAVSAIIGPSGPLGSVLPDSARRYWTGIALLNAGDRGAARDELTEAAKLARRDARVRELIEDRLSVIDAPGVAGPHAVPAPVAELADQLEERAAEAGEQGAAAATSAGPAVPQMSGVSVRRVPVTAALILVNVAVAVLAATVYGVDDRWALLLRAGNMHAGVEAGEWWRLPASMFIHDGWLHLGVNMYGLWVLGKLAEQMLGGRRFFAVAAVSGLVGALASHLARDAGVSVGASGLVLGVMGAALVELALHGGGYPRRWRRSLMTVLAVFAALNIALGFLYGALDQAAHVGGLLAGAVTAFVVSPSGVIGRRAAAGVLATALAVGGIGASVYGVIGAVRTGVADTLQALPVERYQLADVAVELPRGWEVATEDDARNELRQPYIGQMVRFERLEGGPLDAAFAAAGDRVRDVTARRLELTHTRDAVDRVLSVPEPWRSRELVSRLDSTEYRVLLAARELDGEAWMVEVYLPAVFAADHDAVVDRALRSVALREAP